MSFDGRRYEIAAGGYRAVLAEVGACLAGLWHDGSPVTVQSPPDALPPKSTGAVLLPWPNRIAGGRYRFDGVDYQLPLTEPARLNASHGLVKWVRWSAISHDGSSVTLAHDLAPQTGYPFELRLEISYRLDADTGLLVSTAVTNTGRSAAPFGAGFHPYLDLADHELDTAELLVPAGAVLEADERQIPIGRRPVEGTPFDLRTIRPIGDLRLDHGFAELTGSAALLRTERRAVQIRWDAAYQYLQVFTPPFITPGRNAVAIEPMSCPANAFNSGQGLIRLEPGQQWAGSWGVGLV
ncbi:MAG TPA: aldose 1-epimerase family protein [Jatrophihabitans sp.]|jgi:aldose 1-epimerase|uniref:aldose 1-epimerase family protein n=1 Tax=Jatrophihabitans sp. TaxID=1932789 RepID=UPI002EF8904E